MFGTEIFIIDPENEYQRMCDAVGGAYVRLSLNSATRINPFDLPQVVDTEEADNALRSNLITLHGLLRLMMGGAQAQMAGGSGAMMPALAPSRRSRPGRRADRNLRQSRHHQRSADPHRPAADHRRPVRHAAAHGRHRPAAGPAPAQIHHAVPSPVSSSQQSNIDINNPLVVFNIRDLEDELRPVAMYIVLNYIWNKTKSDQKRRILIVDEAWQLMKYEDSANFLFSLAKRARKYNLGITTITQDVEDFMGSRMGRAIVANASMQFLLKQSPSAVDVLSDVFKLTSEERKRLSQFPVGQGLFFAGQNHVHIQVVASPTETGLITTNPGQVAQYEEIEADREAGGEFSQPQGTIDLNPPTGAKTAEDYRPDARQAAP